MLLSVLLSLMTFTVESKSSVSATGTWPYSMDCAYSCSYQKGTVRQGDTATLWLSGLNNILVDNIDVYVRSNKSSGAGTFNVWGDGKTLASISGTFKEWTGEYDNSSFHPITIFSGEKIPVNELTVSLIGLTNSLHIEKFVIQYDQVSAKTVTLMNGTQVYATKTEEASGEGIWLPSLTNQGNWHFEGWSEIEFWTLYTTPDIYFPGNKFFPKENGTLWAVYKYDTNNDTTYVTDLQSSVYLYVNNQSKVALCGVPKDGKMGFSSINQQDENQYYTIDFVDPDTAYITHTLSGTPIGYTAYMTMTDKPSPWLVYHEGEETIFYTNSKGKTYVLLPIFYDEQLKIQRAGLYNATLGHSPMRLIQPASAKDASYSCHPEQQSIEMVPENEDKQYIIPLGIYQLIIRNGQKYLRL